MGVESPDARNSPISCPHTEHAERRRDLIDFSVGSLFSGIGGFDLGFQRAGFNIKWQVEIDKFCRDVLATHFHNTERFDDVKTVGRHNLSSVDVICAGVPCQDVSVAGKRAGLAGRRTGLFYEFARIMQELRPTWFVFENVPGLLSSNRGRDFAEVLRVLMVECGYGVSWRVLNSQFFGVAQRRRRVFLVGCFGRPCPPQILFESAGGCGNSETRSEARQDFAGPLGGGAYGTGRRTEDDPNLAVTLSSGSHPNSNAPARRREDDFNLVARSITASHSGMRFDPNGEEFLVAHTLREFDGHHGRSSPRGDGCDNIVATALRHLGRGVPDDNGAQGGHLVAYALRRDPGGTGQGHNTNYVRAPTDSDRVRDAASVSEGMDYPLLPKGLDSARYRALGNAVTVSVIEWLAKRIRDIEAKP